MTPTEATESLEAMDAVTDADESGVYALRVAVPSGVESVQRRWLTAIGVALPDDMAEQLASAETCLYVGATSRPIRERIAEHARSDVRRASFIRAYGVADVVGVYPGASTGVAERDRARALSDGETCVWANGDLF